VGGAGQGVSRGSGAGRALGVNVALSISLFVLYILLTVLLLLLLASFAVLLKCPYLSPRVFATFFPFSLHPAEGEAVEQPRAPLLLATAKLQHLHSL